MSLTIDEVQPEFGLGAESMAVVEAVHRFARDEMRPVGQQLDKLADPAEVIAAGSPLWKLFDRYRQLGLGEIGEAAGVAAALAADAGTALADVAPREVRAGVARLAEQEPPW